MLIDVREPWEYEQANIGGKNIPLVLFSQNLPQLMPLIYKEIVVYCQSGYRSKQAQKFLDQQGFTKVWNLRNGIKGYLSC